MYIWVIWSPCLCRPRAPSLSKSRNVCIEANANKIMRKNESTQSITQKRWNNWRQKYIFYSNQFSSSYTSLHRYVCIYQSHLKFKIYISILLQIIVFECVWAKVSILKLITITLLIILFSVHLPWKSEATQT